MIKVEVAAKCFFFKHNSRSHKTIEERLSAIAQATPLTTDPAIILPSSLRVLALAAMLLVPVSANAAMGGANPEVATLTPNLRSVTLTAVDTTNVTTTVTFCFDKPIGSLPNAGSLRVGTYRQFEKAADSATRVGTSCAAAAGRAGCGWCCSWCSPGGGCCGCCPGSGCCSGSGREGPGGWCQGACRWRRQEEVSGPERVPPHATLCWPR